MGILDGHEAEIAHGLWSMPESVLSSTWWKLEAAKEILDEWSAHLNHENVKWFTDNKNAEWIVHCGSCLKRLQSIALEIFWSMFEVQYTPRGGLTVE